MRQHDGLTVTPQAETTVATGGAPSPARRWRRFVAIGVVLAVVGTLGWLWQSSRLAAAYSISSMGIADYGGGPAAVTAHDHALGQSITTFTADRSRPADVAVTLVARQGSVPLADGRRITGYTLNGSTPGPTIRARQGQLVEVHLVNESVSAGVTLHWHGVDVPNSVDGVAGVTQDAVMPGHDFTYRFVARDAGTYWYHSHQVSHEQVQQGLLGALVISPAAPVPSVAHDEVVLVHTYAGARTVGGRAGDVRIPAVPGDRVRLRVINTDNGPMPVWVGGSGYRVLAVDGTDVHGPTVVRDESLTITAGGRADVEVTVPAAGAARLQLAGAAVVVGPDQAASAPLPRPSRELDLLAYGTPAPLGFDPGQATRRFTYAIGRRPGLVDGKPGLWWTINGRLYPDVPMFVVRQGDVVRMTLSNTSGEPHPMHLHGHHVVVLSRNGVAATGSPWVVDSLNLGNGDTFEVAFVADNPGIWMDHCHNLPHATEGLVAHLMYEGVRTPFLIRGPSHNQPE
ncbi:MAG: multicopper oxidase family protein [Intrasporangium sp.]|uniref:multicopper oxidase family protein n=1 Tax=Intrasporangium sp. TaxID=1925024 RepID=UPI003F81F1C4